MDTRAHTPTHARTEGCSLRVSYFPTDKMQGPIEQLYPRSRMEYEEFSTAVFDKLVEETFAKDEKKGGDNFVAMLNALLAKALEKTPADEVKELAKIIDSTVNEKIESYNKEIGKTKSKLKGAGLHEDGAGDFSHLENEKEEKVETAEQVQAEEEKQARAAAAEAALKAKEAESARLREEMKKEERVVKTDFASLGFAPMKKKDDDFGFGGKKKGKKK